MGPNAASAVNETHGEMLQFWHSCKWASARASSSDLGRERVGMCERGRNNFSQKRPEANSLASLNLVWSSQLKSMSSACPFCPHLSVFAVSEDSTKYWVTFVVWWGPQVCTELSSANNCHLRKRRIDVSIHEASSSATSRLHCSKAHQEPSKHH